MSNDDEAQCVTEAVLTGLRAMTAEGELTLDETDAGFLPPDIHVGDVELKAMLLALFNERGRGSRPHDLPAPHWRPGRVRIRIEVL